MQGVAERPQQGRGVSSEAGKFGPGGGDNWSWAEAGVKQDTVKREQTEEVSHWFLTIFWSGHFHPFLPTSVQQETTRNNNWSMGGGGGDPAPGKGYWLVGPSPSA